jgi:hypothetical protein
VRCLLRFAFVSNLLLALSLRLTAQQPAEVDQPAEQTPSTSAPTTGGNAKATEKAKEPKEKEEEKPPVVTHHNLPLLPSSRLGAVKVEVVAPTSLVRKLGAGDYSSLLNLRSPCTLPGATLLPQAGQVHRLRTVVGVIVDYDFGRSRTYITRRKRQVERAAGS